MNEYASAASEMLNRAGVAPAAWPAFRDNLKRAVVARALGTDDARLIDTGVAVADMVYGRATGALDAAGIGAGVMTTLAILGGAAIGVAAHILYQRERVDAMSAGEYETRVDNAERDWRRHHVRYATIAEVAAGGYR